MEILSYLFSPIPGITFNYYLHLMIYAGVLILIGLIVWIINSVLNKKDKAFVRTFKSLPGRLIWVGIILIILAASRVNGIAYLSMRFLLIIFLAVSVYIIIKSIYNFFKKYPEMKNVVKPKKQKMDDKPKYTTSKK